MKQNSAVIAEFWQNSAAKTKFLAEFRFGYKDKCR